MIRVTDIAIHVQVMISTLFSDTCNTNTSFLCADLTCIHKSKVCDNNVNCIDGRDERVCEQPFTSCYDRWLSGYRQNVTIEANGR